MGFYDTLAEIEADIQKNDGHFDSASEPKFKQLLEEAPKRIESSAFERAMLVICARAKATNNDYEHAYTSRMLFALEYMLAEPGFQKAKNIKIDTEHVSKEAMMAIDYGILVEKQAMSKFTWKAFFGFMIPTVFILLMFLFWFKKPVIGVVLFLFFTFLNYLFSGKRAKRDYVRHRNDLYLKNVSMPIIEFLAKYLTASDLQRQEQHLQGVAPR